MEGVALITWYFDVEYLRKKLENMDYPEGLPLQNKKEPLRLHALSKLFCLPSGKYSLKIMGHEVLADDSNETLVFLSVPQNSFLVSIYLRGALEKFNREIVTKDWFVGFLRKWIYPPEIKRIPDPRLKEVPMGELRREYLLECPDIGEPVFDATFGKSLNPVVFKLRGETVLVCSETYFAEKDGTLNPKRMVMECDAGLLSRAFLKMGVETLNSLEELTQLLPEGPLREPLLAYIGVLKRFRNFIHSL